MDKKIKGRINEEKHNKKKKKIVKNIMIVFFIVLIISGIVGGYFLYNKLLLKDIAKHYNKYIITKKKTNLYDKNKKVIGSIEKDFYLELEKNDNTKYFRINDSSYYLYYKDSKKTKKKENKDVNSNYVVFNKNIKTTGDISLYKNNKVILKLNNSIDVPIQYQDNEYYYIKFFNDLFSIKKSSNIKEVDKNNTNDKESEYISVFYYENIGDDCSGYSCTSYNNIKSQISKLKEMGYYTISLDDYKSYLNKYVRLKDKAILLLSPIDNENINNIEKELGVSIEKYTNEDTIKLNLDNKKSTNVTNISSVDSYNIKSYTTLDNIVKMASGEDVIEHEPVIVRNNGGGQAIPVLNYHFFYDLSIGETNCNESICLEVSKFREQLDYLKNNNYKTLTMNEFKKWMYGEIELPEKSVLITIDDGAMGTGKHNGNKLIPILEEYKMHATLFLIAGWWDIENYRSPYLDIQSHTYDMHQYGTCGKGQINCATLEEAKVDLQKSLDIIKNNDSFCFPFYSYSDTSLQAVRETGFKIAFVGGNRKATRSSNKFLIPRYPIYDSTTIQQFINMVS